MPGERFRHGFALEMIRRRGLQSPARHIARDEASIPTAARARVFIVAQPQRTREPEFQRIGVDDSDPCFRTDEGFEQAVQSGGYREHPPTSDRVGAHETGLAAACGVDRFDPEP